MSGGDQAAIGYFVAFLCIMVVAFFFKLLDAIFEHPWLLIFVLLAGITFWLAKRAERRERGGR